MSSNLHNENIVILPRDDGVPGFVVRIAVLANHAREEPPHTISDLTMSRDQIGRLIIELANRARFDCRLRPLNGRASREEESRAALAKANMETTFQTRQPPVERRRP